MNNKKGIQLNMAMGAILALILVATLVIVSIYLFSSLETAVNAPNTAGTAINETLTTVTEKGENLSASLLRAGACGTATAVINSTDSITIASGNYTQTGCTIVFKDGGDANFNNTNWKVTYPYTYTASTAASNASDVTITNFSNYPALVGLVGTIVFLGIVIGVLVASFVFGKKDV